VICGVFVMVVRSGEVLIWVMRNWIVCGCMWVLVLVISISLCWVCVNLLLSCLVLLWLMGLCRMW